MTRAQDIALSLEVSLSTVYRDIAHLQGSGLPIDGEAGVGYILREGFDLPNITLTHDQIDALAAGLAVVERSHDTSLAVAAKEVRSKIQAALPKTNKQKLLHAPIQAFPKAVEPEPYLPKIRAAIRDLTCLDICYCDRGGQTTQRVIEPLFLWLLPEGWMLTAWCQLRGDFRQFRDDGFQKLTVTSLKIRQSDEKRAAFLAQDRCSAKHAKRGFSSTGSPCPTDTSPARIFAPDAKSRPRNVSS